MDPRDQENISWRDRARQVQSRPTPPAPINPMQPSPDMAQNEGFQAGQQINKAIAADGAMKTAIYGQLAGSQAGRLASGTSSSSCPDGGGSQACGGGGGASGGALNVKALCSLAYLHGHLEEHVIQSDYNRMCDYSQTVRKGYQIWALPLARWLDNKPLLFKYTLCPLSKAWAKHMAFKDGTEPYDNWAGRCLEVVGVPICYLIGKFFARNVPDLK